MAKRYRLSDGDLAVFRKASSTGNPNWFFNHYLRSPYSGTYWRAIPDRKVDKLSIPEFKEQAKMWREGYGRLHDVWRQLGQPEHFAPIEGQWRAVSEEEYEDLLDGLNQHYRALYELNSADPTFHHNHGTIMLPWQLDMHNRLQPLAVVAGGYGSAKTFGTVMSFLYHGATLRGFRGFMLAPNQDQASEFHKIALAMTEDTLYKERFLEATPTRPRPMLKIGHDHIGQSVIECIPIADDPAKIRTVTGDAAVVDQAEMVEDLDDLIRELGTRFRGMLHGRPKLGQMTLLANSGENPQLWGNFDKAEREPDDIWAISPPTPWNKYLSVDDMLRYERYIADDQDSIQMYIYGRRPAASGDHFSAETLRKIKDVEFTIEIKEKSVEPVMDIPEDRRRPHHGWLWKHDDHLGCYQFKTPYLPDHQYLVAADAGWSNPPKRDTPCVAVLDYTYFPYQPARLVAASWVFGEHSPEPFLGEYTALTKAFHAQGHNAFDATAQQAGYDRFLLDLDPTPVSMGGNRKWQLLTLLKTLASHGLLSMPDVAAIFTQLANYKIPDERLVQDWVATLMVACHLLEPLYYAVYGDDAEPEDSDPEFLGDRRDRYERPVDPRYSGHRR